MVSGILTSPGSSAYAPLTTWAQRNTIGFVTGANTALYFENKTSGAGCTPTAANWAYRLTAQRGW